MQGQNKRRVLPNTEEGLDNFQTPSFSTDLLLGFILCTITVVLIAAYYNLSQKKLVKRSKQPTNEEVFQLQWTPIRIPLLNELITYWKTRKYGVRLMDQVGAFTSCNIVTMKLGWITVYFLRDLEATQKLLRSTNPDHMLRPKEYFDQMFPGPLSNGILAGGMDVWIPHRKALSPAFSYRSLGIYFQYANDCMKQLIDESFSKMGNVNQLNQSTMGQLLDDYGLQLTSQMIMGPECSAATSQARIKFHESLLAGKAAILERFLSPVLLLPPVWRFHPKRQIQESALATFYKFATEIIHTYRETQSMLKQSKKGECNVSETKNDAKSNEGSTHNERDESNLIDCMLKQLIISEFSDEEIISEILTFFIAGYETVRVALDLLIFQLALHPEYQRRCQAEVDAIMPSLMCNKTDRTAPILLQEDLPKLKYLEQCILESLRITPTIPAFIRHIQSPIQLTSTVTVQPGEIVVVAPWAIHRHAEFYPNPLVFDPDRFTAENIKKRHQASYLPFSSGKRSCIGNKLALVQMRVFMAWLIRHFEFTTTDKADDVKLFFAVATLLERPYNITYKRRNV